MQQQWQKREQLCAFQHTCEGPHNAWSLGLNCNLKRDEDVCVTMEQILKTEEKPENPEEIFILLRDELPDDSVIVEFVTDNKWVRTEPEIWSQKVRWRKALDFPSGFVNVNVYCGGVIKGTTQIEYYRMVGEMESLLQRVVDLIAFTCQASRFSSTDKIDAILTFVLDIPVISHDFNQFPNKNLDHHCQRHSQVKELPTLLHCATKFGLKKLASLLLHCPEAAWACKIINKYGENPGHLAEKYGHKEIQKIIKGFSVSVYFSTCHECLCVISCLEHQHYPFSLKEVELHLVLFRDIRIIDDFLKIKSGQSLL
ncbi:hypothetical protein JRQ81_016850 [Phrynocephalus forsythii]|uniref:DBB domain-containing protein n=1 Tax=Phrynocephalus forsythii TaxID=171643 RepID=A0A9Q0XT10_9SAUR|nr:hypothetical protein JRQ81_016850 [Phrynocephalus forsythii]